MDDSTNASLAFLDDAFVREACAFARVSPEVTDALAEAAAAIARDPNLTRLAAERHEALLAPGPTPNVGEWPSLPEAPLFYAVVLLSGVPRLRELHAARGIDEAVTLATLADLELWIRDASRSDGVWSFRNLSWLAYSLRGELFALGRLQYLPGTYPHPFRFFRHRGTRRVVALALDGLTFRADGQFASADGGAATEGLFTSRLEDDGSTIRGNPVDASGHVLNGLTKLTLPDWEEILSPGDPVLTVHIPASGPMDPGDCERSFDEAARFFPAHLPEVPWRAFTCHSWLLGPTLATFAPQPVNIVAFLRSWYLHPTEGASDAQTLQRVFGDQGIPTHLPTAERTTALQRSIRALMDSGGRCRDGGSVFFAEDLPFTPNRYR